MMISDDGTSSRPRRHGRRVSTSTTFVVSYGAPSPGGCAAPNARERQRLRREHIGVEGRIAELVGQIVIESEPMWVLLADKYLPADLTVQELDVISEWLRGRPTESGPAAVPVSCSLKFSDPDNVGTVRAVVPGDLSEDDVTAYRYMRCSILIPTCWSHSSSPCTPRNVASAGMR
jgi:hypothetical protein